MCYINTGYDYLLCILDKLCTEMKDTNNDYTTRYVIEQLKSLTLL